jgi:hypothetical protein
MLNIEYVKTSELIPYVGNAKIHTEEQIMQIMNSIQDFGMNDPIAVWKNNEIIEGHGRLMACQRLGIKKVPIIRLENLTDEERKAYGLAHNKLTMNTDFDFTALDAELEALKDIDMSQYGFDGIEANSSDWFQERKRYDNDGLEDESEEYQEFVDKFELKKTTDDCYTPDGIYEAVADWVAAEYGVDRDNFVRPFYPNGDYQKERYKPTDIVVDNPPFSIMSEILKFYSEKGIRFFLFAPTLTLFSSSSQLATALVAGVAVTYENGATVNTSFLTNLEDRSIRLRSVPTLYEAVRVANDKILREMHKELPKYEYPGNVITAPMVGRMSRYGVDFALRVDESHKIGFLDAQKEEGKGIFGGGYLVSEKAAAEKAAAEKAAAEKAAAEKTNAYVWQLSNRELEIIESLNR